VLRRLRFRSIMAATGISAAAMLAVLAVAGPVSASAQETTMPVVESVEPNHGRTIGFTPVLIDGNGLSASAQYCLFFNLKRCDVSVHFGEKSAFVFFASPEDLIVFAPANSAGTVDITVTVDGVTSATTPADQFTYEPL
jgi:large repetitive protein